ELAMEHRLVVEVMIAAIHRQRRSRNRHQDRSRPNFSDLVAFARSNHDLLVIEAWSRAKFGFDIGAHPAAKRRVKGANVDDPHCAGVPPTTAECQMNRALKLGNPTRIAWRGCYLVRDAPSTTTAGP